MELRDILLFLHADGSNEAALALASRWALAHGASVTGCCLCADPPPSIADSFVIGYDGAADVLDRRRSTIEDIARPVEAALRAAAAGSFVADWSLPDPNEPSEALALRARFFDLAIVPRAPVDHHPARILAEALALNSGGPCVITPRGPLDRSPERIVVAWNGSAQARRALDDALPLLKSAAAVQLLVIGADAAWLDRCRPEQTVRRLARHDVDASLSIEDQNAERTGQDLAIACDRFEAGLLVMGAYSHTRTSEVVLGGATRAVLADFPIPVLMSR